MNNFNSLKKSLDNIFDDKYISTVLILFLVLYGGLAAPTLPNEIANLFKYSIFKIMILSLIGYYSTKNYSIAVLIAISFYISYQTAYYYELNNNIKSILATNIKPTKLHKNIKPVIPNNIIPNNSNNVKLNEQKEVLNPGSVLETKLPKEEYNQNIKEEDLDKTRNEINIQNKINVLINNVMILNNNVKNIHSSEIVSQNISIVRNQLQSITNDLATKKISPEIQNQTVSQLNMITEKINLLKDKILDKKNDSILDRQMKLLSDDIHNEHYINDEYDEINGDDSKYSSFN